MRSAYKVVTEAGNQFLEDDCLSSGAAIAFYTVFSLPPLLTIVFYLITLVGFSEKDVIQLIKREIGIPMATTATGTEAGEAAPTGSNEGVASENNDMFQGAKMFEGSQLGLQRFGLLSKIVGIVFLLISAAGVFGQLQYSLDKTWEVKPDPRQGGVQRFLTKRILSAGIVLVIGFLLLVSLVLTTLVDNFLAWYFGSSYGGQILGMLLHECIMIGIAILLFAFMFKILPDAEIAWKDVWVGALCTGLLFEAGKFLISWYLEHAQIGLDWGTAATSVIGVLVWVYYSSLIVLFGAEITQVWSRHFGNGIRPEEGAIRVVTQEHEVTATGQTRPLPQS